MEEAVAAFEAAGYRRIDQLNGLRDGDFVLGVDDGGAELLREADRRAIKYVLVHDGDDDGHTGGTYERAHHRIGAAQRDELAQHLRSRERPLITCLAFAYKNGAPSEAALLVDARFLDNPYWIPELRDLSGRDPVAAEARARGPGASSPRIVLGAPGRATPPLAPAADASPHRARPGARHSGRALSYSVAPGSSASPPARSSCAAASKPSLRAGRSGRMESSRATSHSTVPMKANSHERWHRQNPTCCSTSRAISPVTSKRWDGSSKASDMYLSRQACIRTFMASPRAKKTSCRCTASRPPRSSTSTASAGARPCSPATATCRGPWCGRRRCSARVIPVCASPRTSSV